MGGSPSRLCVRMKEMKLEVDCYSGRTADERPIRFRLDGHEYLVEELIRPVVRAARYLFQSPCRRRQSLHLAPRDFDARWILASGIIPATEARTLTGKMTKN